MCASNALEECLQILELSKNATYQDARKAYRHLITQWHPDKFETAPPLQSEAVRISQEINAAFEYLAQVLPDAESTIAHSVYDTFDTSASEWSAYYSSYNQGEVHTDCDIPVGQFEQAEINLSSMSVANQLLHVPLMPFKFVTDIVVYFIFERPLVPAFIFFMLAVTY